MLKLDPFGPIAARALPENILLELPWMTPSLAQVINVKAGKPGKKATGASLILNAKLTSMPTSGYLVQLDSDKTPVALLPLQSLEYIPASKKLVLSPEDTENLSVLDGDLWSSTYFHAPKVYHARPDHLLQERFSRKITSIQIQLQKLTFENPDVFNPDKLEQIRMQISKMDMDALEAGDLPEEEALRQAAMVTEHSKQLVGMMVIEYEQTKYTRALVEARFEMPEGLLKLVPFTTLQQWDNLLDEEVAAYNAALKAQQEAEYEDEAAEGNDQEPES